jgi:hypothetical protein
VTGVHVNSERALRKILRFVMHGLIFDETTYIVVLNQWRAKGKVGLQGVSREAAICRVYRSVTDVILCLCDKMLCAM